MILKNNLKNTSGIQGLTLDIDDTLTRFLPTRQYLADTLAEFNLPYSADVLSGYFKTISQFEACLLYGGNASSDAFAKLLWENIKVLKQSGISPIDFKNCLFVKEADYTKPAEGVQVGLESLHQYYRLFCYTKWFREQQEKKLIRHNLLPYIESIYAYEDDRAIKTTQGFESLAAKLREVGISKNGFVHIGDSIADIVPCEKVGIQSILIDYNGKKEELYPSASAVVTEFSDLEEVLLRR